MKDGLASAGRRHLPVDSDPAAEDRECQVRPRPCSRRARRSAKTAVAFAADATGSGKRVLLIDHDDSFVHMLADISGRSALMSPWSGTFTLKRC